MKKLMILTAAVMALMAMALPGIALGDTIFVGSSDNGIAQYGDSLAIQAYTDPGGGVAHFVMSSDGTKLYCATSGGDIDILDPVTLAVAKKIAEGKDICDMAFKDAKLYALGADKLLIISDSSGEITDEILLGTGTAKKLLLSPASSEAYVITDSRIIVVNLSSKTVGVDIPLADTANDALISADGSKIFVAEGKIEVISIADKKASQTIDCGAIVKSLTPANNGGLYALTADGEVLAIDTLANVTKKPKVGDGCSKILKSPDGSQLIMLSHDAGRIYKVDEVSFGVIAETAAPRPLQAIIIENDIGIAGVIYSGGVQTIPNQTVDEASFPEGALTAPPAGDGIEPMGAASVTIVSPNDGEKWRGTHPIMWFCSFQPLGTCNIYASVNGGSQYNITIATGVPNSGSYNWNTSSLGVDSTQCRISIIAKYLASLPMDTSDNNFTVDNTAPVITVTSPTEGGSVSGGTVNVIGSVSDMTAVTVQMRVTDFGTYPTWQNVTLTNNTFNYPLAIPASGSATIEVRAIDATLPNGNVTTKSINVQIGYQLLINLPVHYYYSGTTPPGNLSSVAATKDIVRIMREGQGGDTGMPASNDIYTYGHILNRPENASLAELDPRAIELTLNHFDPWGVDDCYRGYNFGIYSYQNTPTGYNDYLKEIIRWMSWPVSQCIYNQGNGNPYNPADLNSLVAAPNAPAALPSYADTQGYNRWIIVNGYTSDINPFKDNPTPWKNPFNMATITISGLYLTDPAQSGGIGENVFKAAAELPTFLKPLTAPNPTDRYNGKYVFVAEPPAEEFKINVEQAPPIVNESTTNLISMAEYANNEEADPMAKHLLDSALAVDLKEPVTGFSTDNDLLSLFKPEATKEESKISWQDVIEPTLFLNDAFKSAIDDSVVREFIKVHRKDTGIDYYVIPFDKLEAGRYYSYAAIIVDAQDGHFMEASYVEEPTIYVQVSKEEAIEKVMESVPGANKESIEAILVWEPDGPTLSPFYPYWEVTAGEKKFYVATK